MHPLVERLFAEIEHGDEKHRAWLREKLELWSRATFGEPGHWPVLSRRGGVFSVRCSCGEVPPVGVDGDFWVALHCAGATS